MKLTMKVLILTLLSGFALLFFLIFSSCSVTPQSQSTNNSGYTSVYTNNIILIQTNSITNNFTNIITNNYTTIITNNITNIISLNITNIFTNNTTNVVTNYTTNIVFNLLEVVNFTNAFNPVTNATGSFSLTNVYQVSNFNWLNISYPYGAYTLTNIYSNLSLLTGSSTNSIYFTNSIVFTNYINTYTYYTQGMPLTNTTTIGTTNCVVVSYTNSPYWSAVSNWSFSLTNSFVVSNFYVTNWLVSSIAVTLTNLYTNTLLIYNSSNAAYLIDQSILTNLFNVTTNSCAPVTFSQAAGSWTNTMTLSVTLSCATPGVTIFYSTNAKDYILYTAALSLTDTTTLSATATRSGFISSMPASVVYNLYKWRNVGNAGFSAGAASYTTLNFGPDGLPYVAYEDGGNGNKATMMKYNGTNWVNVGSAGFSAGQIDNTSLAFGTNGLPYVAYSDYVNGQKATAMMFNGTNWVNIGSAGFSSGQVNYVFMVLGPNNLPYVAYSDYANGQKATVMKYNGTNWVNVGTPGFSVGQAICTSLMLGPDGLINIAYNDIANSGKSTVMKFNGTNWVNVGSADFSAGGTSFTSLILGPDNLTYIAYMDQVNSQKSSVMKYNGTNWVNVGIPGFSAGTAAYPNHRFWFRWFSLRGLYRWCQY